MTPDWNEVARATLAGAQTGAMTFPETIRHLMAAGFDGYAVDFRAANRTYYLPDGAAFALEAERLPEPVAARFDTERVKEAIREAQALAPGYTYAGFCAKVAAAGCAGYLVSLGGRRVVYFGRSGETHTELFPGATP